MDTHKTLVAGLGVKLTVNVSEVEALYSRITTLSVTSRSLEWYESSSIQYIISIKQFFFSKSHCNIHMYIRKEAMKAKLSFP